MGIHLKRSLHWSCHFELVKIVASHKSLKPKGSFTREMVGFLEIESNKVWNFNNFMMVELLSQKFHYTPVDEHSNGKFTIWRCISYLKWWCSIAMLVYQRVSVSFVKSCPCFKFLHCFIQSLSSLLSTDYVCLCCRVSIYILAALRFNVDVSPPPPNLGDWTSQVGEPLWNAMLTSRSWKARPDVFFETTTNNENLHVEVSFRSCEFWASK